jgi:hypothetical protein
MRPHLEIIDQDIENPMWSRAHDGKGANPRLIRGQVNTLESPVSYLASKGALTASQVAAADIFRKLFERVGGAGARAIDYSRPHVDGGGTADPINPNQLDAGLQLKRAHDALTASYGRYAWLLVMYICGEGKHIREMTETRRQHDTMLDGLRMYLDCLAAHWKLSSKIRNASETY